MKGREILIGYLVIALWTFGPLLPGLLAATVASLCGARLDEGNVHPSVVLGCDIGGLLAAMGVLMWYSLVTIPTGFLL